MNDLTDTKTTIRFPKIHQGYINATIIGSLVAIGIALIADTTFQESLGTLLVANAITFTVALMARYID